MSGHSKWATIKRKKEATDSKRSSMSRLGTLSGTFLRPSISSEKQISRVLRLPSVKTSKAWRTMAVRATSPNVPMCGSPEGP